MNLSTLFARYYTGEEYLNIRRHYSEPSLMEIFEDDRSENSHSGFLAWLLRDLELRKRYDSPLYRLLHLAYQRASRQNNPVTSSIATVLFNQEFRLEQITVDREYTIQDDKYGEGRLDVFIQSRVSGRDIYVIVENKVKAVETTKNDKQKTLFQSVAYHSWLNKQHPNDLKIFLFLSPISSLELDQITPELKEARCKCKDFIHINYQDILDYIIEPLLMDEVSPVSQNNKILLKEYKKALGKPGKDYDFNTVMAMSQEERQMLIRFFESNKDLILAALDAKTSDPDADEDERTELNNLKESVQKASRPRSYFSFNGQGRYRMFEATNQFIQELESRKVGIDDIVSGLKECDIQLLTENGYQNLVSDNLRGRFSDISVYSVKYYLQNGYAFNKTDSVPNPNFPRLMTMAQEKYQILIEKIL